MNTYTIIEQKILNRIQKDCKITETPFEELANEIGINEDELLSAVSRLKKDGIIRDISAIFNASMLGYHSSLIAFEVSDSDVESASMIINEHPGVSHNYLRDHKYNIWFTITIDNTAPIEKEVSIIAERCRAEDFLILKNKQLLKIGLMLEVGDCGDGNESTDVEYTLHNENEKLLSEGISEEEKRAIYLLQMDLPLMHRPFKYLIHSNNIDIDEESLILMGERFKREGIMRRYSAILRHNRAGYNANAMTVWKTDSIQDDKEIASIFSSIPNISHLYLRTVYPGKWEYPLFAMIHAKTSLELNGIIKRLEERSGIRDYLVLNTLREFKKKRVKLFQNNYI
ncbi:MAG: hypothetical protein SVZ03_12685 [Spirochaetota bacterium]|nr:hypothetical protein [Spirochaetota bacterium]